jgi:predicted secreted hydrolase
VARAWHVSRRTLVVAALAVLAAAFLGVTHLGRREGSRSGPSASPVALLSASPDDDGFTSVNGPVPVSFPADEGPHPGFRTEWWYYTGHLRSAEGRRYGFQLTFFRNALSSPAQSGTRRSAWATDQAYLGHLALSDVQRDRFWSFERLSREALGLAGARAEPFRVWVESWSADGIAGAGDGAVRLSAAEADVALDLELRPVKPVVLHGDAGHSVKGPQPGNASMYYSFGRLEARGSVTAGSRRDEVTGTAWMDHEWSTSALDAETQSGWDWFSLQLDDGTELMLFEIRERDGGTAPESSGSFVDEAGEVTRIDRDEFVVEVLDHWRSPRTGALYPSRWRVRVPALALDLTVTPAIADQELSTFVRYWEGAVDVDGRRADRPLTGRGYVELTGYADAGALPGG